MGKIPQKLLGDSPVPGKGVHHHRAPAKPCQEPHEIGQFGPQLAGVQVLFRGLPFPQQPAEKPHPLAALEEPIFRRRAHPVYPAMGQGGDFPLQLPGLVLGHCHKLVFYRVPHPECPTALRQAFQATSGADHPVQFTGRPGKAADDKKGIVEQKDLAQIPLPTAVAVVDQAVVHLQNLRPGQKPFQRAGNELGKARGKGGNIFSHRDSHGDRSLT